MLDVAHEGLSKRGLGEEEFLQPLEERLKNRTCPGERAARVFREDGIAEFMNHFAYGENDDFL